jgi:hypothetical protein
MIKYPASLSVTAYSYFFATIFMVLTGVSATNGLHEWALTKTEIIAVLYAVSNSLYAQTTSLACITMMLRFPLHG